MKISYQWLKEYLEFSPETEALGEELTAVGLEVEGIESYRSVPFSLKGVVTGEVKSCVKHPDADRLSLTKVDVGTGDWLDIVCGAPNVAAGQKVLVATVGTRLPDGKGGFFEIKEARIRGAASQGMICAEDELGLSDNHDGIMVLPDATPVGMDAESYLGVYEDTVLEIGLTPNRSDANSHIGVARDVVAFHRIHKGYSGKLVYPEVAPLPDPSGPCPVRVQIKNEAKCLRYSGLCLRNVVVKESPAWLRHRLAAIGQASINNVVDITNYVLWEFGQPLHAFDADKIAGQQVLVQTLPSKTPFRALDGKEYALHEEDLMICDGNGDPMCMAGVYGGLESGVTASTKRVFLESAVFAATGIRRSSQRHVLHTSAAKAFEKGIDPENSLRALQRAAFLLIAYADAEIDGGLEDHYPHPGERAQIEVSLSYLQKNSGAEISMDETVHILESLEMDVRTEGDTIKVSVPANKPDVQRPADILEEVLRMYGLDRVPMSGSIRFTLHPSEHPDREEAKSTLAGWLSAQGYHEIMCLSLSQSKYFRDYFGVSAEELVYIHNTSNTHLDAMRYNLLAGGLEAIAYNLNRRQSDLLLYEMGSAYCWKEGEAEEREQIVLWQTGRVLGENWLQKGVRSGFYSIKTVVDQLFRRLGLTDFQTDEAKATAFAYGIRYSRGNEALVTFGALDAGLCRQMDVKQEVYAAVMDWPAIWEAIRSLRIEVKEPSRFPEVRRDLSLIVRSSVTFAEIRSTAFQLESQWLREVSLFDVYEHEEHVGPGKKSYAISFTLQPEDHTLSEKELEEFLQRMISGMETKLHALIRR
jgi:phenylalanyl-tRNA synthetase beta chain